MACALFLLLALASSRFAGADEAGYASWRARGFEIPEPLGGRKGDPARGRAIASDGARGNCLACHRLPLEGLEAQGDLGPPLAGIGARQTVGMLRLHVVDQSRFNPDTVMPGFHRRPERLHRVGKPWRGRPFLTAQQIEDVVAWLATLK